jgi:hypothetical protein
MDFETEWRIFVYYVTHFREWWRTLANVWRIVWVVIHVSAFERARYVESWQKLQRNALAEWPNAFLKKIAQNEAQSILGHF